MFIGRTLDNISTKKNPVCIFLETTKPWIGFVNLTEQHLLLSLPAETRRCWVRVQKMSSTTGDQGENNVQRRYLHELAREQVYDNFVYLHAPNKHLWESVSGHHSSMYYTIDIPIMDRKTWCSTPGLKIKKELTQKSKLFTILNI